MAQSVRVRVLNVGQGDAIVGILPSETRAFVVDVYDADRVLDFLDAEGISEVILFLSHSDRDHTAGASDFIAQYPRTGRILAIFYNQDRLNAAARSEYVRLTRLIGEFTNTQSGANPQFLYAEFNTNLNRQPDFIALFPAPCSVSVLHPARGDQSALIGQEINEMAGVLIVRCEVSTKHYRSVLLAADVQLTGISLLLARQPQEPVTADVLKFPHHGAWPMDWPGISFVGVPKRTLDDFLRSVSPSIVILSTGFDNREGHVRREVFDLLKQYQKETGNLKALKCTQFTSTCLGANALPATGELSEPHCAGDVEVEIGSGAEESGVKVVTVPGGHPHRVSLVDRAGCAGCRFLPEIAATLAGG